MVAKKLLIVTAFVETATGVMLLVSPTRVVALARRIACLRSGRRVWTRRHP